MPVTLLNSAEPEKPWLVEKAYISRFRRTGHERGAIMTTDGLQENAMMDKAKGDSPQDVMFAHASMVNGSQACLLLRRKTG
ncbi:hypothetical protein PABG_12498 [Paracoccidioides brasiliensis Pb03]|nr:hypothetical protein PABG_12498 [Paracoccidioides brasiliensis Pb03]